MHMPKENRIRSEALSDAIEKAIRDAMAVGATGPDVFSALTVSVGVVVSMLYPHDPERQAAAARAMAEFAIEQAKQQDNERAKRSN